MVFTQFHSVASYLGFTMPVMFGVHSHFLFTMLQRERCQLFCGHEQNDTVNSHWKLDYSFFCFPCNNLEWKHCDRPLRAQFGFLRWPSEEIWLSACYKARSVVGHCCWIFWHILQLHKSFQRKWSKVYTCISLYGTDSLLKNTWFFFVVETLFSVMEGQTKVTRTGGPRLIRMWIIQIPGWFEVLVKSDSYLCNVNLLTKLEYQLIQKKIIWYYFFDGLGVRYLYVWWWPLALHRK